MADQGLPQPGRFVTNALVTLYQDRITQLISDLGRNVVFTLTPQEVDCPNCGWDYAQNRSNSIYTSNASGDAYNKSFPTGTRCPVCFGKGKLIFPRTATHKCLIGFPDPDEFDYAAFGLKPTQVIRLKNRNTVEEDLEKAQYALIDGFECEKLGIPKRSGLRDIAFVSSYWKRRNT
jgi:hypothetical protein